jgi:hypothetical protein
LNTILQKLANIINISLFSITKLHIVEGENLSFTVLNESNFNKNQIATLKLVQTVQNLQTINQTLFELPWNSIKETYFAGEIVKLLFFYIIYIFRVYLFNFLALSPLETISI